MWKLQGLTLLIVVAFMAAACSSSPAPASAPIVYSTQGPGTTPATAFKIVTTTNILGDWAKQIGRERVEVFSLMPIGADAHTFQPGARDVTRVAEADLVLSVGLTLEGAWLKELIENAAADSSKVVALGEVANPVEFAGHGDEEGHEDEDERGELDPHFWFDPLRVKLAVAEIANRLAALDSEGAETYLANSRAYQAELDELDRWIEQQVSQLPEERRLLVTSHESFGYFARRYGFRTIGTVIPGVTTEREPSAQELAALVDGLKAHKVPAIFTEGTASDRLAQRVAEEAGIQVVTQLFTESLGEPGSGADTYIRMMRKNVDIIVEALR